MRILSVEEAQERVLELCSPLSEESVAVDEAMGRAPTQDVLASRTLPPVDCSATDGYALHCEDSPSLPATLTVIDRVLAGQAPSLPLEPGSCTYVALGAELPRGADAVVAAERVQVIDEETVELLELPLVGENLRRRGDDSREGQPVVSAGTAIGLGEAGRLWSQGAARLTVHRRPSVAITAIGDTLANAWEDPHGRAVDTNSPMVAQAVRRAGGVPQLLGVVAEHQEAIGATLRRGLAADVLLVLTGAEVGEKAPLRHALAQLGVVMDYWGVAMQPGRLIAVGRTDRTLVLSMPGNPASALVSFELFVKPALRGLQGLQPLRAPASARAASRLSNRTALKQYLRATVTSREGALWALPLPMQLPEALASVAGATHLICLGPDANEVEIGSELEVIPVDWGA